MQFLQTNAADFNALLIAIRNFLAANGWTTLVDGTGGGGLSLEMTNGNSHDFKIASRTRAETDVNTGAFNDRLAVLSLQKSDVGLAAGYTAKAAETNDCAGPFGNVWLFTDDDATFCHVVLQTYNARYAHFSFGDLNNQGAHAFDVPYAFGLDYTYWQFSANYSTTTETASPFNSPHSGTHNVGMFCEDTTGSSGTTGNAIRVMLPNGILDPALGFAAGAIEFPTLRQLCSRYDSLAYLATGTDQTGRILDYFRGYDNQGYTGGVPIFPLPIIVTDGVPSAHTYIGDLPAIGLVNMAGLTVGQILDFAGDDWIVFPLKQYGLLSACNQRDAPQPVCNSINYGIAVKKTGTP